MTSDIDLKDRERVILGLLADRMSDRAIASRLSLAPETVRWYNKQLYAKLGVTSRAEAVSRAVALGLIGGAEAVTTRLPVERSPIRYVTNEGVSIAYQVIGRGPIDLLFMTGFVSHVEISWDNPEYTAFFETLGRVARVITFDKRGVGLSDRVHGVSSIENTISDARAVLEAVGSKRAFVSGTSESGAAAVLLASMYPEQVRGLILVAATAMPARRGPDPEWARPADEVEAGIDLLVRTWGQPYALERLGPSRLGDPDFEAWWARTLRAAASPASVRMIVAQAMQVDIRAILPQVRTRAVVIHRTGDRSVAIGAGRFLASEMPNATLVELPGIDHIFFIEGIPTAEAMLRFMADPGTGPDIDTWVAIVLHMAGSGSVLDDAKKAILEAASARQVRTTPNGWTALFTSPNGAIRCAERLRDLGRGRVGGMALHVGACQVRDGAPVGAAHEVGFRLVQAAAPGEILVSATLRDLLAGSAVLKPRSIDGGDTVTPPTTVWSLPA